MGNKCLYMLFGIALALVSCHEQDLEMSDSRVVLNAVAQAMDESSSRAIAGVDIHKGTSVTGMQAAVWFSDQDGIYPGSNPQSPTFLPYRANLTYDEGSTIVYTNGNDDPVSYVLEGEDKVYCVGLYPQSGWTAGGDNTTATHAVDGKQDLMFASQQSGTLLNKMGKQVYRHLLAWLKFTVRATDPEAMTDWGKITSIQLVDAKGNVTVTLGSGAVNYSASQQNIEVLDASMDLGVYIQDLGSALCIPKEQYTLKVVTEKKAETTLTIKFEESGQVKPMEAGKLYLVNLYFNLNNEINAVCSLVPWNEEEVELN